MKTERDRMFQVESKIRQKELDDKTRRENRNRKVSYLLTEKVECRIEQIDGSCEECRQVWGSKIIFETNEGSVSVVIRGKTKNSAEVLARTFLDKMDVKYRITRG